MKKTKIAILGFLLIQSFMVSAQSLVLTMRDGSVTQFALQEEPVVTYSGGDMVVTCGESVLTTSMQDVLSCTFDNNITGITKLPAHENDEQSVFNFSNMTVEGLKTGTQVSVYTIDGKMISQMKANESGRASIDIAGQRGTIYIVRTPKKTFKIKK